MWLVFLAGLIGLASSAKLQDFLSPDRYDLTFTFYEGKDTYITEAVITFKTAANIPPGVSNIIVHSRNVSFSEIVLKYPSTKKTHINPNDVTLDSTDDTINIPLSEPLASSGEYVLRILYSGTIEQDTGFIRTSDDKDTYYTSVLYPAFARRLYPCFDQPNMRAIYTVNFYINYLNNKPVIVTGLTLLDNTQSNAGNKLLAETYSSEGVKLPPYGIAFTIGNYKTSSNILLPSSMSQNDVSQNVFYATSGTIGQMVSAAGLKSVKVVLIPGLPVKSVSGYGFAGIRQEIGTELSRTTISALKNNQIDIVVAVVKSLYGTVVSPSSWSDIWISESVPLFIANQILPKLSSRWSDLGDLAAIENHQVALANTWSDSSLPIRPDSISSVDQLLQFLIDPAVQKGAAMLGMVESIPQNYQPLTAFVNFIKDRKGNAVSTDELFDKYEEYAQLNATLPKQTPLKEILKPWLAQPGYPGIEITRKSSEIVATETMFGGKTPKTSWIVPLFIKPTSNDTSNSNGFLSLIWLNSQPNAEIVLAGSIDENNTVFVNVKGTGLYRVHYQAHELELLANKLQKNINACPPDVRVALLSDAAALAGSGYKFSQMFALMQFLQSDRTLSPWLAASKILRNLWTLLYFSDMKQIFENYATNLLRPTYIDPKVGGLGLKDPSFLSNQLRKLIVSQLCDYEDENCRDETTKAFKDYIPAKENTIVASDVLPVLYCNGIKQLSDVGETMGYFQQKYSPSTPSDIKRNTFSFMACLWNNNTLEQFLQVALLNNAVSGFPELPPEDSVMAFEELVNRPEQIQRLMGFLRKNYANLNTKLQPKHKAQMIRAFGRVGSTDEHLTMLNFNFGNSTVVADAVKWATGSIKSRKQLLEDNKDDIKFGLTGYGPTVQPPTEGTTDHGNSTSPTTTSTVAPPNNNDARAISASLTFLLISIAFLAAV